MLPYWRYADRFGWLPSQVRAESFLEMQALATIDDVVVELRNDQQRHQSRPRSVEAVPDNHSDSMAG
jgi:hypothetical protein